MLRKDKRKSNSSRKIDRDRKEEDRTREGDRSRELSASTTPPEGECPWAAALQAELMPLCHFFLSTLWFHTRTLQPFVPHILSRANAQLTPVSSPVDNSVTARPCYKHQFLFLYSTDLRMEVETAAIIAGCCYTVPQQKMKVEQAVV